MLYVILLVMLQSFSVYSMEHTPSHSDEESDQENNNFIEYYDDDEVKHIVNLYLQIYNICPPNFNLREMLLFFAENEILKIAEKIITDTDKSITETLNCSHDNKSIASALVAKKYQEKVKEIMELTPIIVETLQSCSEMPMGLQENAQNATECFLLQQMWYCYWLYMIPNSDLYFEKNQHCLTHNIIKEYPISIFTDHVFQEQETFLNAFDLEKHDKITYLYKLISKIMIPKLSNFIDDKQLDHNHKKQGHITDMLTCFKDLKPQYKLFCSLQAFTMNDTDEFLINKISHHWKSFWKNNTNNKDAKQFAYALNKYAWTLQKRLDDQKELDSQKKSSTRNGFYNEHGCIIL